MKQNNIRETLGKHAVIPVVSFDSVEDVEPTIAKLIEQGIHCIEITLRNDCAFECIEKAISLNTEGFDVGIGTEVKKLKLKKQKILAFTLWLVPVLMKHLRMHLILAEYLLFLELQHQVKSY